MIHLKDTSSSRKIVCSAISTASPILYSTGTINVGVDRWIPQWETLRPVATKPKAATILCHVGECNKGGNKEEEEEEEEEEEGE